MASLLWQGDAAWAEAPQKELKARYAKQVDACYKGDFYACRALCRAKYNGGLYCAEQFQSTFNPNIPDNAFGALIDACVQNTNEKNVKHCQTLCKKGMDKFCNVCRWGYDKYCNKPPVDDTQCKFDAKGLSYAGMTYIPWELVKFSCLDMADEAGLASCYQLCKQGCKAYCDPCKLGWTSQCKNTRDKKRGVGLPGVPVGYSAAYSGVPPKQWKGFRGKRVEYNHKTLRSAYKANAWGTQEQYDGEPTPWETDWLMVNGSPQLYKKYLGDVPSELKPPLPPKLPNYSAPKTPVLEKKRTSKVPPRVPQKQMQATKPAPVVSSPNDIHQSPPVIALPTALQPSQKPAPQDTLPVAPSTPAPTR